MPSVEMNTGRFTSNALDTTRKQLLHSNFRLWHIASVSTGTRNVRSTPNSGPASANVRNRAVSVWSTPRSGSADAVGEWQGLTPSGLIA